MKKFLLILLVFFIAGVSYSQDFSNKGKEFWLAYCYHVGMVNAGGSPVMTLYITSDITTTYTVEIYGGVTIQSGTINPNQVIPVVIPNAYFINNEGIFTNKAVHVTAAKPIVVYSYITRSQASAATLCLPTNVLGRQYYAMSFTQTSNEANANSFFTIVAVEDNTTVEIIPTANTKSGWIANSTHTVNLNKGEIYQVLGTTNGNNGVDISGSSVRSIASATSGCKKIAVFSGSGKISIGCNGGSADNLYQQLYPVASWGKKYLTVPSYNRPNNYYRIIKSTPAANVYLNGVAISAGLFTNNYYQFINNTPNLIESDLPISVTQYFTTQGCSGNGSPYDPDMIVLNPVEQNISNVTLISSNLTVAGAHEHHLHVIMKSGGTGISSFKFDNVAIPAASWVTHPSDPTYSYLYIPNVSETSHQLSSDSGFNALAYGYGNAETYGYSAGTNVKDLYQQIGVATLYGIETTPSVCTGSPFQFKVSLPYQPLGMDWDFHGFQTPNVVVDSPVPDSTTFVNGKQIWWYSLPTYYTYNTIGAYPVTITTHTNNSDGCGTEQDIDFDLEVSNPPVADYTFVSNGCVTQPVQFTDATNSVKPTYKWWWSFGDPGSGANNISALRNPSHLFSAAGTYTVRFSDITTPGCLSDTVTKTITVSDPPVAKFGITAPNCLSKAITFSDTSSASPPATIVKWYWDFGDGFSVVRTNNSDTTHIYNSTGLKTITLRVETTTGCQSNLFTKTITISANPIADFTMPNGICLPADSAHFFDISTIADGTQNSFGYSWNFGDPPSTPNNISSIKNPVHYYNNVGPFSIKMIVTSGAGCVDSITKVLSNVYLQPHADFTVIPENCFNDATTFTSNSNGNGNAIVNWFWNFGDGSPVSNSQNPTHTYASPGVYTIKHWIITDKGCLSDTMSKIVTVNSLPTANFNFTIPSCDTKVITFTDGSAPNSGALSTWTWDFGDIASGAQNTSSLQSPTHIFSTTGTYTVSLSVKTDKGCQSSILQKQVTINAQPQPGFILPEVCLSDAFAQFTDTSKINSGSISAWSWDFGDPGSGALNTSTTRNPQHRYNSIGNYTVTLSITSNNNCVATLAQSFTVNGDIPVSDFTTLNPAALCANDSVAIQNGSTVNFGSVTKVEIYWDNTGSPAVFQTDDFPTPGKIYRHLYPNFQNPLAKTFTIRYRSYSGASCVSDKLRTITVNAAPKAQFLAIPNACFNAAPYQITQASSGGVPGTPQFTGPGISSTGIFTPSVAGVGTHLLHYTFTSSAGCVDTASQQITVLDAPVANFGFSSPSCETKAITFSDSSTTPAGTITKWTWDYNDGSAIDQRVNGANFTHIFSAANSYNVKLTVTTGDQCNSITTTKTVKINPEPKVDFSKPVICLPDANATFTDQSIIADGTESGFTYLWDFGDLSSGNLNTSTQKNPGHIYSAVGPYNVTLSVTSNNGCEKDTTIAYNNIHPQPNAKFTLTPVEICINSSVSFIDLSNGADATLKTWLWNFGDGVISSQQSPPPHTFTTAGTYSVRLTVTNNNNCISPVYSLPVIVNPFPVVNAGPDRNVLEGGNIILEPTVTGNSLQYLWTPPDYLSSRIIKNPIVTGVADVLYTLKVTGAGGCSDSDKVFVKVLKFPKIPNTFTPNNDNINDTWIIQYLETYPGNRVQVFNRYGQLVFESRGYGKPWDGTMNGKPLPFGTYYYIIEPGNGRKPITGYVTLLK